MNIFEDHLSFRLIEIHKFITVQIFWTTYSDFVVLGRPFIFNDKDYQITRKERYVHVAVVRRAGSRRIESWRGRWTSWECGRSRSCSCPSSRGNSCTDNGIPRRTRRIESFVGLPESFQVNHFYLNFQCIYGALQLYCIWWTAFWVTMKNLAFLSYGLHFILTYSAGNFRFHITNHSDGRCFALLIFTEFIKTLSHV